MFGDTIHGFLLFLFGLYLIFAKDYIINCKPKSALLDIVNFRYLIVMMGFFAFYCGLIYNEFASLGLNLFNSCYDP